LGQVKDTAAAHGGYSAVLEDHQRLLRTLNARFNRWLVSCEVLVAIGIVSATKGSCIRTPQIPHDGLEVEIDVCLSSSGL
jgi:hypothetical protein